MKQLNQVLIEGLLTRSTPDVYHLTNDGCLSITVYIVQDTAKTVRVVGSLKRLDNIYYIDAESVEVKPQ